MGRGSEVTGRWASCMTDKAYGDDTYGAELRACTAAEQRNPAYQPLPDLPKAGTIHRQTYDDLERSVGVKVDSGKPPLTMGVLNYFPTALLAVAEVSAYGAKKYNRSLAEKNWLKVPDGHARYSDALGRHLTYEATDPKDAESGLYHDQMAAWNALARLELRLRGEAYSCNYIQDEL